MRPEPLQWRDLPLGQKIADVIAGAGILGGLAFILWLALQAMAV